MSQISSNFGQIRSWIVELPALERWGKNPHRNYNGSDFIFDLIFFFLAGKEDMDKYLNEFQFRPDATTDY